MKKWLLTLLWSISMPLAAQTKVLAFAGSTRTDSYNKKLAKQAALITEQMGAKVTYIDLRDFPMPLFDEDLEKNEGMPENAKRLRKLMLESQGVIIASPEYNGSLTAVLKNAIDWCSRSENDGPGLDAYKGRKFAIMAASPGRGGGARSLKHLQFILEGVGAVVVPTQVTIPNAYEAFNDKGELKSTDQQTKLKQEIEQLLDK